MLLKSDSCITCNNSTTLEDVDYEKTAMHVWGSGDTWKSVPFSYFCCEPITAFKKIKSFLKNGFFKLEENAHEANTHCDKSVNLL